MSNQKFSIKEVLKLAEGMEIAGYEFYTELSKKVKADAKKWFEKMANEEKLHAATFKKWFNEQENSDDDYLFEEGVSEYFKIYANSEGFGGRTEIPQNMEDAIKTAIETELETIKFYEGLIPLSNKETAAVLNKIIEEEKIHYENLSKYKEMFGYSQLQ